MGVYIARRLLWLPVLLLLVSLVTFILGRVAPGDPAAVILGSRYSERAAANIREEFGLNKSLVAQYADFVTGAMRGDFGVSYRFRGQPVTKLLGPKIWVSFQVNAAAMLVSLAIGLPMGFWIAHKQGRWQDPTAVTISLVLMSIPIMVSIPFVLRVLCLDFGWVPCSGWGGFWDTRIIVPAITMGVPGVAALARLMRASTLDVMGQDFIRTAYAKGLSGFAVDYRHVLKNSLIPVVTILSFYLAGMLGTSFIVERILGIPGIGDFAIQSIFNRDYPVIMAITLITAAAFVMANLLADITYSFIDPRIRYS